MKVHAGKLPYDQGDLERLRRDRVSDLFVQRHDDIIEAFVLRKDVVIPGSPHTVELSARPALVAALARECLIRYLGGDKQYPVLTNRPLRVISGKSGNLIAASHGLPEWLEKRLILRFDTRVLSRNDQPPRLVLVCDVGTRNRIAVPCSELHRIGVNLTGRYVTISEAAFDPRLQDYRRIVGRVVAVENGLIKLEDHAEKYPSVLAKDVWLEPRRDNWNSCVTALLGGRSAKTLEEIDEDIAAVRQGDRRLDLISEALTFLGKRRPELLPGLPLCLGPLMKEQDRNWPFVTRALDKPTLVFSPSGAQTGIWAQRELDRLGPYDQRDFTPKAPRIAVICQERHQGEVSRCVGAFLEGIPDATLPGRRGGPPTAVFLNGFIGRFRMAKPIVETFTATDSTPSAYEQACRQAFDVAADGDFAWDFAIVQLEASFRMLSNAANPYFVVRAMLLKRGIQVQAISIETMRLQKLNLAFSLSNVSLAAYAKIGGVPWLLRSQPNTDHELVIGLGSHTEKSSRLGTGVRTVGITTVFSSDGRYLFEDRTVAVPFDQYSAELKNSLQRTISRVRREDAWRASDAVRLVFHVFKPLKSLEVDIVEATVRDLGIDNVRFAFIHVVDDHPFVMFDEANPGVQVGDSKCPSENILSL